MRGTLRSSTRRQVGEQVLQRLRVVADPVVAAGFALGGVFEPVERAQDGIVAQMVVIVQVLVAEGEGHDALGHQRGDGVFGARRIAVVGEAGREAVEQLHRSPDLSEQQDPGVGSDRAAVERGRDFTALAALKSERDGRTLCWHRFLLCVAAMFLGNNNLATTGGRCLLHLVRNPG